MSGIDDSDLGMDEIDAVKVMPSASSSISFSARSMDSRLDRLVVDDLFFNLADKRSSSALALRSTNPICVTSVLDLSGECERGAAGFMGCVKKDRSNDVTSECRCRVCVPILTIFVFPFVPNTAEDIISSSPVFSAQSSISGISYTEINCVTMCCGFILQNY